MATDTHWAKLANDAQRRAIEADGNCLVVAGPGTGKTRTLLTKALQVIQEEIAPAAALRIVNFTRAGVRDLQRKVLTDEDYSSIPESTISTFHSLALKALFQVNATSIPNPLVILDDWEEETFIDRFAKDRLGLKDVRIAAKRRRDYNSRWCLARVDVDDWLNESDRYQYEGVYNQAKDLLGFATRGELTFLWWRHLDSIADDGGSGVLGIDANYLLTDEYQDLNECEHEILQKLASNGISIFAVGDPNQSIYEAMRHAHPGACLEFTDKIADAELHVLEHSYRCPAAVLRFATALMGGALGIPDAKKAKVDGEAHVLSFPTGDAETSGVSRLAERLLSENPAARILIALPRKSLAEPLIAELTSVGLDVDNRTTTDKESNNCRLARALLAIHREPRNSVAAATAIILYCAPSTRAGRVQQLLGLAYAQGVRVAEMLTSGHPPEGPLGKAFEKVAEALRALSNADDVGATLSELTGCGEMHTKLDQVEDVLSDLLDDTAALDEGKVTLMTLHASKGLEADWVFMPALEPGFYEGEEVGAPKEERRRLLFVGMTRAIEGLFLSFAQKRYGPQRYGDPTGPSPIKGASSFVSDICGRLEISPENASAFLKGRLGD